MKKICILFLLICSLNKIQAQNSNTDSLWRVFENTKNDSLQLDAFNRLYAFYIGGGIDSNFYYSNRLIKVCNKLNIPRYNALGPLYASYVFFSVGDFIQVQKQIAKARAIAEKLNDEQALARIENFNSFIEDDPNKKIQYLRKAIQYQRAFTRLDMQSTILLGNISGHFIDINQPDSAFYYAQKMYEQATKMKDSSSFLNGVMGNAYLAIGQPDIAYVFLRKALKRVKNMTIGAVGRAFNPMAKYFEKMNQPDSALYYWKKTFELDPREKGKLLTAGKIYQYYLKKGMTDSAARYMEIYIAKNDSINNNNKIAKLQAAKFEEELRQQELVKTTQEEEENRRHNIQLGITAIAILSAFILFLLLSRSFIIHHKVVAFLSAVILLIVFEFINLLIHPFLEKITHHSPILMLLALVAIASLIVPMHHKLEHWATNKLVEKNKAIRLANAKKTIEELEKKDFLS